MMPSGVDILERDGITLVFGLEWFPLLGSHPERQARSLSRRRRASHRVVSAGGATAVGLLRGRLRRRRGWRSCSAAAAFASLHPAGTVAAVLPFPDGRRWLVAAHEGAVMTRTDQMHDAGAPLDDVLRLLREAHPGLVLHDEGQTPSGLLDALFEAARNDGELRRGTVPAGASAGAFAACALAAAGYAFFAARGLLSGTDADHAPAAHDAAAAWRGAVAAAARPHTVHGVAGLTAALESIQAVPVAVAGWRLAETECRPQGARWHCRARYRRGGDADNQGFIAAADPGWALSFEPLEGADAAWSAPMPAMPLAAVALREPRQNEARLVSALQAMLPAFSELRLDAPQALPLRPPLDAQHRPIARPPGIAGHRRRNVRVQAPLRSLGILLPETVHMSWDRIVLQVVAADQPSLRGSSLRVSLSGVLYEIDDPHPAVARAAGAGAPDGGGHGLAGDGTGTDHGA